MKKIALPLLIAVVLGSLAPMPCAATNYEGGMNELLNAMGKNTTTAQTSNVFTATGDINLTQNLGSFATTPTAVTSVTLNGANHNLDGAVSGTPTYSGITVGAGQVLNINNYGSLNSDGSVLNSIKNFVSTTNGGFLYTSGTVNLNNSVFSNNHTATSSTYSGGAIYENAGTINVNNSVFVNNTAGNGWSGVINVSVVAAVLNITDSKFIGNVAYKDDGAIGNNGIVNISNSSFTNNSSTTGFGGAIGSSYLLTIVGSQFTSNSAATNGGAIYNSGTSSISDSTFGGDDSTYKNSAVNGGAIYTSGTLTSVGNKYKYNNATTAGGAIYNSGILTSTGDKFLGASIVGNGGAIFNFASATSKISGATFGGDLLSLGNSAVNGGAIYMNGGTVSISSSSFGYNSASNWGGAVCNNGTGTLNISGTSFQNNSSTSNGGGIFTSGTLNILSGSSFTNNTASTGGAIYASASTGTATAANAISNITGATFTSNGKKADNTLVASNGGAVANIAQSSLSATASSVLNVSDNIFDTNEASVNGGAIYNYANTTAAATATGIANAILNISNTKFGETLLTGNSVVSSYSSGATAANANGGVIYNAALNQSATSGATSSAYLNVFNGSSFLGNNAQAIISGTGTGSALAYGGAIYSISNNAPSGVAAVYSNIYGSTFTGNYAKASSVAANANAYGGAICNAISGSGATSVLNIFNTDFSNNYVSATAKGDVSGTTQASAYGGAIYNTATLNIFGGTYSGNYATATGISSQTYTVANGGAIYNSGTAVVSGATFIGNSITSGATYSGGGAIYACGNMSIYKSQFTNNTASDSNMYSGGGAIYDTGATLTLYNNVFTDNGLKSDGSILTSTGGALDIVLSTTNIYGSTFVGNKSLTNGGAAVFASSNANIYSSIFTNNATTGASGGGGAVYKSGTSALKIYDSIFSGNSSSWLGGAIYNAGPGGSATITNSTFTNNTSVSSGGAICNPAGNYLNLIADSGITYFNGNTQGAAGSKISNAIFNNATLNLNAGNGGYVLFNDKIDGTSGSNLIYINRTGDGLVGTGYLPSGTVTNGNVIFNEQISNATIDLKAGIMTLGQYHNPKLTNSAGTASSTNYFNNSSLTLDGGTLNAANGNIDSNTLNSLTSASAAKIFFDANLSAGTSDLFTISGASSGTLTLGAINIMADNPSTNATVNGTIGLLSSNTYSSFATTALDAYTNHYLYTIAAGSNTGTLSYTRTGDASYNGLASAVADTGLNVSFSATNNVDALSSDLGAIGGATPTSNSTLTLFGNGYGIDGNSKAGITVAATQTLNIYNFGSYDSATSTATNPIQNFSTTGVSGAFISNSGTANIVNSVFKGNATNWNAGVIYNAPSASLYITDSTFLKNSANNGAAISSSGTIVSIYNSLFGSDDSTLGNTATSFGGAIRNDTNMYIYNSIFKNNSAGWGGGAISNNSNLIITNSIFNNNKVTIASYHGGAIYAASGTLKLIADGGDTTFTGNTDSTGANDIYISSGTVYMNSGKKLDGSNNIVDAVIEFDDSVKSSSTANTIEVNKSNVTSNLSGTTYAPTNGTVNFYGDIAADSSLGNKLAMNIYDGTVNFGKSAIANINIDDVNLSVTGGSQNFTNTTFKNGSRLTLNNTLTPTADSTNFTGATFTGSGTSAVNGGALSLSSGTMNITNSNFKNYITSNSGGVIYEGSSTSSSADAYSKVSISNGIFGDSLATGNSASLTVTADSTPANIFGGAIYAYSTNSSSGNTYETLNITNGSSFTGNNAFASASGANAASSTQSAGGAIYLYSITNGMGSVNLTANISDSTFTTNYTKGQSTNSSSTSLGGALAAFARSSSGGTASTTTNITGTTSFSGNYAQASNSVTSAAQGGVIYNGAQGATGSTATSLETTVINVSGHATFDSNYVSASASGVATAQGGTIWNQSINSTASTATANINLAGATLSNNHSYATSSGASAADARAGAIYNNATNSSTGLTTATVSVSGTSKFENNYAEASSTSGQASAYGGAIYNCISGTSTATVNISDTIFTGNYAKATSLATVSGTNNTTACGGAIYNAASSTLNITGNTQFSGNHADAYSSTSGTYLTSRGGAIYNAATLNISGDNNTFSSNYVLGGDRYGGAIFTGGTFTMSGTNSGFSQNYGAQGGAIYVNSGTVNLSNITFSDNGFLTINSTPYLTNAGGAIFKAGTVTLNSVKFTNNVAGLGGAIDSYSGSLYITNGNFTSNGITSGNSLKTNQGGAIYQEAAASLLDIGSTYKSNQVASGGGAIYNLGTAIIKNATFGGTTDEGNKVTAANTGGAIYNSGTLKLIADGADTTFTNNTSGGVSNALHLAGGTTYMNAGNGGSIIFNDKITTSAAANTININASNITSTLDGTAFAPTSGTVDFYNDILTGDNLSTHQLAMNIYGGTVNFGKTDVSPILNNIAFSITGGSQNFTNETFQKGSRLVINNTTNPTTDVTTITSSTLNGTGTITSNGGAIDLESGTLTITGTSIARTTFSGYTVTTGSLFGGAIYNKAGTLNIDYGKFLSNSAYYGGAIYNAAGATATVSNSIFGTSASDKNSVGFVGGAIYNAGKIIISSSSFTGNHAPWSGGAFSQNLTSAIAYITDTNFYNNSSTYGGAICTTGQLYMVSNNANSMVFSGNTATYGGDLLFAVGSSGKVYLNTGDGGSITFNDSIASIYTADNSNNPPSYYNMYINKDSVLESDGVTYAPTAGTVNMYGALSDFTANMYAGYLNVAGASSSSKLAMTDMFFNIYGGTTSFNYVNSTGGSRIVINDSTPTSSETTSVSNSSFAGSSTTYFGNGAGFDVESSYSTSINNSTISSYKASGNGGAIYNASNSLNITNTTLGGVDFTYANTAANGGAIYNSGTANITNSNIKYNSASTSGGAIYNNNTLNYTANSGSTSYITNNTATSNGGAIYNSAGTASLTASNSSTLSIANNTATSGNGGAIYNASGAILNVTADNATVNFTGNSANSGLGGAIYNQGTTNIISQNGGSVTFSGNSDSNGSNNAIYLAKVNSTTGSVLNLYTLGSTSSITFNDKINSDSLLNEIDINKPGTITTGVTSYGNVYFYNTVTNSTVNLYNGTLVINDNSTLSSDVFNLLGGTIGISGTTTINGTTFAGSTSTANSAISVANGGNLTLGSDSFYGNLTTANGGAINNAGTLTITGSTFGGNDSSYRNTATNGGAIYNTGTAILTDTSFKYNSATANGGAIYNDTTGSNYLAITASGSNVEFINNSAGGYGNDIYLKNGTVYLNAASTKSITFNDGIYSDSTANKIEVNSSYSPLASGSINFACDVISSTINTYSGTTNFGVAGITKYLSNDLINILGSTTNTVNFTNNAFSNGSQIAVNNTSADVTVQNSTFTASAAEKAITNTAGTVNIKSTNGGTTSFSGYNSSSDGGAISNAYVMNISSEHTGSTVQETDTYFSNNRSAGNGGAVNNSGFLTVSASNAGSTDTYATKTYFSGNYAVNGGAIYNANTTNISAANNASVYFSGNTASSDGGAIYNAGTLKVAADNATVLFDNNSANGSTANNDIYLASGNVYLNAGNSGSITLNDGISSASSSNKIYVNNTSASGSSLADGTVNLNCNISDATLKIENGTTNIGSASKSTTESNVLFDITGGRQNFAKTTFANGSRISLNSAPSITTITGAVFNSSGTYSGDGGVINVAAGNMNIVSSDFSGYKATGNGGAISNAGTLTLTDSSFTNNISTAGNGGAIYNSGILTVSANNSNVTFSDNMASGSSNAIYLDSGSVLNLKASSDKKITFNDAITSASSGTTTINVNGTTTSDTTSGTVEFDKAISATNTNLYGGTLSLGQDNYLNGTTLGVYGGTLNLANGTIGTMSLGALNINANTNLAIDANLANSTADYISANSVSSTNSSKLSISRVNILSDANQKNTDILIADANTKGYITLGSTTAESQLYKYNLTYDGSSGNMTFVSTKQFNSTVITTPVATLAGTYLNQVNAYSEALGRTDVFMSLPQSERTLMRYNNKYAAVDDPVGIPQVFSPTYTPDNTGGLWVKQYTSFENIPLNGGPNVSSVGYGALIGGDTPLKHLKHGFDGFITTYVGYDGSHQNYNNVGIYQNGGLLGVTGTVYKGNFFAALTASAGTSNGNASTPTGTDNFTTLMAGTALKTGYNLEFLKGKLILQPSLMASYTFLNTFDYESSNGANITSEPLHAIQLSPGLKLISNMENGWQPYLSISMVWNFMDSQKFYANDVQLPQMSIDPYFEYGVGVQRRWGERFTGFGQAMLRGGGRNGVALQFGFRYAIGK